MTDVELLKLAVYVLSAIATTIGSALIGLVIWNAKAVLKAVTELRDEVRGFDRRITRLEAKTHWRLFASEKPSFHGGD